MKFRFYIGPQCKRGTLASIAFALCCQPLAFGYDDSLNQQTVTVESPSDLMQCDMSSYLVNPGLVSSLEFLGE